MLYQLCSLAIIWSVHRVSCISYNFIFLNYLLILCCQLTFTLDDPCSFVCGCLFAKLAFRHCRGGIKNDVVRHSRCTQCHFWTSIATTELPFSLVSTPTIVSLAWEWMPQNPSILYKQQKVNGLNGVASLLAFISSVQSFSHAQLFATALTAAGQASLSITSSWSLQKLMSIESVMQYNHVIQCCPLLLMPSIFLSIRVFSNESVLCTRWPKDWSFSFNISPSSEYSGLISFWIDWFDLLEV